MKSKRGQDELAFAIFKAFQSYKREVEADNATTPAALPTKRLNLINSQKSEQQEDKANRSKISSKSKKIFKIQLASSNKSVETNTSKWKKVKFPIEMKRENGNFKYLAGDFRTLAEAKAAREKIRKLGFKGAFVVAYRAGKRVKTK